jgi:hypothetical protein
VKRIRLCEGNVFSVENLKTGEVITEATQLKDYLSIMGYFAFIQKQQTQYPDEIRVKLNRSLGFPEEIWVNPSYKMGDDEISIEISNIIPLKQAL